MNRHIALGADIGGSHISCAAIDLLTGKVLKETLTGREVNNQELASVIIAVWADAVSEVLSKVPQGEVKGISYIRGVSKYDNLYSVNITEAISDCLNVPEDFLIRYMNDASAFAVGEAWAGSAAKFDRSLSITLGTGFGSAFISNRIPIVDGPDVPKLGCIYHIPYEDGIADDYFSTRWFMRRYKSITGKELSGVKELSELAAGDKIVRDLFIEFGDKCALFLAPWLKKFKAEILVIGGNISHAYKLFGDVFEEGLKKENCNCEVALSELKEDAALMGSAYLLDDDFWKSVQHALPLM